jgi:hypothetical protein
MDNHQDQKPFRRKGDWGIPFIIGLFVLATILGIVVFRSYVDSAKQVAKDYSQTEQISPSLTITECAQHNIEWFAHCDIMSQMCNETVSRLMKVCLMNGEKAPQCAAFGDSIYGYNFGAQECSPYFKDRRMKRACADTWQTVADYCKAVKKSEKNHAE